MPKRTEYLVTHHARNGEVIRQMRVPKAVNPKLLLERLISRDLDDETLIASCLTKRSKRAYDPFQIIDMREEHRIEQARSALKAAGETKDPIGVYNRARSEPIPAGKVLLVAGVGHDFFVKEVGS